MQIQKLRPVYRSTSATLSDAPRTTALRLLAEGSRERHPGRLDRRARVFVHRLPLAARWRVVTTGRRWRRRQLVGRLWRCGRGKYRTRRLRRRPQSGATMRPGYRLPRLGNPRSARWLAESRSCADEPEWGVPSPTENGNSGAMSPSLGDGKRANGRGDRRSATPGRRGVPPPDAAGAHGARSSAAWGNPTIGVAQPDSGSQGSTTRTRQAASYRRGRGSARGRRGVNVLYPSGARVLKLRLVHGRCPTWAGKLGRSGSSESHRSACSTPIHAERHAVSRVAPLRTTMAANCRLPAQDVAPRTRSATQSVRGSAPARRAAQAPGRDDLSASTSATTSATNIPLVGTSHA
jgi:hypothetical protein